MRVDVERGKYTVVFNEQTGDLSALRYGQPWQNCTGDKLIYALAAELAEARQQIEEMRSEAEHASIEKDLNT